MALLMGSFSLKLSSSKESLLMLEFSPAIRTTLKQLSVELGEVTTNIFQVEGVNVIKPRRLLFELGYKNNANQKVIFSESIVWIDSSRKREFAIPLKPYVEASPWILYSSILDVNPRFYSDCTIDLSRGNLMIVDSIPTELILNVGLWNKEIPSAFNSGDGSTRSIVPARIGRKGGIIHSNYAQPVYIGFGAPPVEQPNSMLSKGSRIEIPLGFEGQIFCNFKGQVTPASGANAVLVSVIEYVKE
jgi:hypothetical protein